MADVELTLTKVVDSRGILSGVAGVPANCTGSITPTSTISGISSYVAPFNAAQAAFEAEGVAANASAPPNHIYTVHSVNSFTSPVPVWSDSVTGDNLSAIDLYGSSGLIETTVTPPVDSTWRQVPSGYSTTANFFTYHYFILTVADEAGNDYTLYVVGYVDWSRVLAVAPANATEYTVRLQIDLRSELEALIEEAGGCLFDETANHHKSSTSTLNWGLSREPVGDCSTYSVTDNSVSLTNFSVYQSTKSSFAAGGATYHDLGILDTSWSQDPVDENIWYSLPFKPDPAEEGENVLAAAWASIQVAGPLGTVTVWRLAWASFVRDLDISWHRLVINVKEAVDLAKLMAGCNQCRSINGQTFTLRVRIDTHRDYPDGVEPYPGGLPPQVCGWIGLFPGSEPLTDYSVAGQDTIAGSPTPSLPNFKLWLDYQIENNNYPASWVDITNQASVSPGVRNIDFLISYDMEISTVGEFFVLFAKRYRVSVYAGSYPDLYYGLVHHEFLVWGGAKVCGRPGDVITLKGGFRIPRILEQAWSRLGCYFSTPARTQEDQFTDPYNPPDIREVLPVIPPNNPDLPPPLFNNPFGQRKRTLPPRENDGDRELFYSPDGDETFLEVDLDRDNDGVRDPLSQNFYPVIPQAEQQPYSLTSPFYVARPIGDVFPTLSADPSWPDTVVNTIITTTKPDPEP